MNTEAKAVLRSTRISPQKARLVADQVRNLPVARALGLLKFSDKKAAQIIYKVIYSATSNAENNNGADRNLAGGFGLLRFSYSQIHELRVRVQVHDRMLHYVNKP